MENLRRLWHFVVSPNYSRTLTLLLLLTLVAAVPLTVYVSQQRQELRQRAEHLENDYACNRPHQVQVGEDVGDCDAGNGCTGNLYAQYDHTADTDGDGTADSDDPDDQPYCVNTSCSEPITCPTPTPEPTATPQPPPPTSAAVPPTTAPPTTTPATGGQNTCSTVTNNQFCTTGSCASHGMIPGTGSCGEARYNCCKSVTATATPTQAPGRICLQCVVGRALQDGNGCDANTPNCEAVLTNTPPFLCKGTSDAKGPNKCGPGAPTAMPVPSQPITPPPGGGTATPIPAGTKFSLILKLQGIGSGIGENPSPKSSTKQVTVQLFDPVSDEQVAEGNGELTYNPSTETFKGTKNVSANIQSGNYTVRVKSKRYLRRRFPGVHSITAGGTYTRLPQVSLVVGDANGDNQFTIEDYNLFISCFEGKATTSSCSDMDAVDFNSDGKVDIADFKLQAISFQTRQGD